jgi:deoxyribonuclease (pyrimidine dimer)
MTRINMGIQVEELCDQHLVAEYRELPRCRTDLLQAIAKGGFLNIPGAFALGTGHMRYFRDKGLYLKARWLDLCTEMHDRGMAVHLSWREWPESYRQHDLRQVPRSDELRRARHLLMDRITQRLAESKRTPTWTKREAPAWARRAA